MDAPVADVDARSCDQALDLTLRCSAEAAHQLFALRLGAQSDVPPTAPLLVTNRLTSTTLPTPAQSFLLSNTLASGVLAATDKADDGLQVVDLVCRPR